MSELLLGGILVVASWFGPGLYGNVTACGQVLDEQLVGVAHRSLPCGSTVVLQHNGNVYVLPVVDRGPFVDGREFDLTSAARELLDCDDLCDVEWVPWW